MYTVSKHIFDNVNTMKLLKLKNVNCVNIIKLLKLLPFGITYIMQGYISNLHITHQVNFKFPLVLVMQG